MSSESTDSLARLLVVDDDLVQRKMKSLQLLKRLTFMTLLLVCQMVMKQP